MNPIASRISTCSTAAILVALAGTCLAQPFLASRDEPHATLRLDSDHLPTGVVAARITVEGGQTVIPAETGEVLIKPGEYIFTLEEVRHVWIQSLTGCARQPVRHFSHDIKIVAQPGKTYYLGARTQICGEWEAVLWKTSDQ